MTAGMPRFESLLATLVVFQIVSLCGLTASAEEPGKSFVLTVLSAENDAPLAGAEVEFRLYAETRTNATVAVDEAGIARFDYPADAAKGSLYFTVRAPGFVAYAVDVDESPRERFLTEKTVRLQRGVKVGGIVLDEKGKPLADASVRITVPMTETARAALHMSLLGQTTGEDGRWLLDGAPTPVDGLSVRLSHPEFLPESVVVKPGVDVEYPMKRGWSIRGVVKTSEGEPLEGARVHPGGDIWGGPYSSATTDAEGKFALHGLPRQRTHVTVSPKRHSPARQTIDPEGEADAEIEFVVEPAKAARFRVVDAEGKPIAGAFVAADTWRGMRNVDWRADTDANGEVVWEGAPSDVVLYHLGKSGFIAQRDLRLIASEEPFVIELSPEIRIVGAVAADAGGPIKDFKVTPGRRYPGQADRTLWNSHGAISGRDGRFELTIDEQTAELFLKIEAEGYAPYLSPVLKIEPGLSSLDVRLEPAKPGTPGAAPEGVVLAPDGTPAVGAAITLGLESHNFQYLHGYRPTEPAQSAVTNAEGRFALRPLVDPKEAGMVAIVHDSGYAEAQLSRLAEGQPIRLEAWARLEVVAKRGSQALADAGVSVQPEWRREQQVRVFSYGIRDKTDAGGVVVFDRVVPGRAFVGLELRQPSARGETVYSERSQRVDFRPGETSRVELGGDGRAIIGKIELPPNPPAAHDWTMNEGGEIVTAGKQHDDPDYRSYRFLFAKDGTFRIEDVPPGEYSLNVRLTAAPDGSQCGTGERIGDAKLDSFVHDDSSLAANDLGSVAGSWIERIGVGSAAPFFVARTAQGGVKTLDDYRGKLTLLDFWATWCGPCLADMPRLAELHEKYRGDERFALIAVALDQDFESAKTVAANGDWKWTVVDGGAGTQSLFARSFDILAIPDKVLVGPDGTILYRGNDLAMVDVAIAEALKNFPASTETASPSPAPGASVVDDFQPSSKQAGFVAAFSEPYVAPEGPKDHQAKAGLFLYAADGTLIRQIADLTPDGWLKRADRLAVDRKRGRVYATEADRVLAVDRDGRTRFDVALEGVQAIAVDERTGDLWCLCLSNLGSGWTIVLGEDGQRKGAHPSYGFTLRFSPQYDAFWVVGESARLVARDGSVLAEHALDEKAYTFGAVAVDAKGDCWALESSHPDVPGSADSVWKISRQEARAVDASFAYNRETKRGTTTNWVEAVGDEVWVGWSSIDDEKTKARKVRRFAIDGAGAGELGRDIRGAAGIGDAIWAYADGDFVKLDAAGAEIARVEHGEPVPEGVYQNVWIAPFE